MRKISLILLFGFHITAYGQITSNFDSDADGWSFSNPAGPAVSVSHSAAGGNPGGFISASYGSNISFGIQNWVAPAKYLGNQLAKSLGMNLKFDLQQPQAGSNSHPNGDVRIGNTGIILVYSLPSKPAVAPAWSSYSITLDETQGWRVGSTTGPLATRTQIISALTNLTFLQIRGTYATNATYTSGLDNVVLEQRVLTPAPVISSLSATSGKPGDVITINGSGFNVTPSGNSVSFGVLAGIKAEIQSATATQLTVVVPPGAVYGPITITNTVTGLTTKTSVPFNPVFDKGGRIIPASYKDRFTISTIPIEGAFAGDLDGDGWEDFAVTNNNTEDVIDIYRNLALGGELSATSFAAKVTVTMPPLGGSGTNGAGLWFADLDGDGNLDIVSSTHSGGAASFVTLRNMSTPGNMAFEAPEYWAGGSDETPINLITDLDGDGRLEIIAGEGSGGSTSTSFFWAKQNISAPGNIEFGGLIFPLSAAVPNGFAGSASGDLNGDGKKELILSHSFGDRFTVLQNTSSPGAPSFLNAFTLVTGQYNRSMTVVDVNLDGKNDLVWKKSGGGVYIRINSDTDGALTDTDFATEFILTSDLGANGGINIVDFNGDGKPDIASTDDSEVGVYENIFDGGMFSANAYIPAYQVLGAGAASGSPGVSDFNHDGKPDFIISSGSYITIVENRNVVCPQIAVNTVSPLKGPVGSTVTITGSNFSSTPSLNSVYFGAVEAPVLSATATQLTVSVPPGAAYAPVSVRVGEFASRYRLPFATTFSSGVTFNNTHFAPPVNFTLTNANYDIEVGDLNRDGKPDILAEANGGFVFRNTHTSGAITTSSLLADDTLSVNSFINPRLEDFDGDGFLDVASVNGLAHKNNSTPTEISHLPAVTLGLGGSTMDMSDFNNDGKFDITVTVDLSGAGDLLIRENRTTAGSGNFTTGTYGSFSSNIVFNKPAASGGVLSEDFDGDGFADIATTNSLTDNISVYRNAGLLKISGAQFASRLDLAVGDTPGRIYKGDFDVDGKTDLMLYHGGTNTTLLTVFHNTSTVGNLSFTRIDLTNPSATTVATIADLDGDGKPEIITTSETGNRFSIFKNIHATGALTAASFATPFSTTVTAPRGIATGDLNLDGKPEIIITRAAGLLVVYENLIPTILQPTIISFNPASGPIGTTVTITGTNFSATPSDNIVTFNGTTASVTASTATTITTSVPSGATTGPISVSVAGNSSTSTTDFTVIPTVIAITTQPSSLSVCSDITAIFATAATGTTNISYQWQYSPDGVTPFTNITNGGAYANATTPMLSVNTTENIGAGRYRCYITGDAATPTTTNEAELIIITTASPVATGGSQCDNGAVTLTAQGAASGQYRWYSTASGGTAIPGETNDTYTTPMITATTTYYVSIANGSCESQRTPVVATISPIPSISVTGASGCAGNALTLNASGGANGQYRWHTDATGTNPIAAEVNGNFTTPVLTQTTTYYVDVTINGCQSQRMPVVASVSAIPSISVTAASACSGIQVTLSASGGNDGEYQWYSDASGSVPINGEVNSSFTTPVLTQTTTYYVAVSVNGCQSQRTPVVATIFPNPSILVTGASACPGSQITLLASGGSNGEYKWYTDASSVTPIAGEVNNSFTTPALTQTTSYFVTVTVNGCESSRAPVAATIVTSGCAPEIETTSLSTLVEGTIVIDLKPLITTVGTLDIKSIKVASGPASGAITSIENGILTIIYSGVNFGGSESITIEACNTNGLCTQQHFTIEVNGDIIVYNAVSPNDDGKNETFILEFIDVLPSTKNNKVSIYNRWGDEVFSISDYDNKTRVFSGRNKEGNKVPPGTYFYKIQLPSQNKTVTGYLSVKY